MSGRTNPQPSISEALAVYRKAVRDCVYWEDHGRHGDGKPEAAKSAERKARAALNRAILAEQRAQYAHGYQTGQSDSADK